jgi:alpha-L-fucosidase
MAASAFAARAAERPAEDAVRARRMAAIVQEPVESGPVEPTSAAIKNVPCPAWFRDAKFGIWSHWGPNCFSGVEQNYAKEMYRQGSPAYKYHMEHFGDPAKVGFKDVIKYYDAAKWDPDALMKKYKAAGARYFVSLARYHDNFDMYDSSFTPWNSVNYGPKKDIAGLWRQAALKQGLRFGLSFHPNPTFFWEGQFQNKTKVDYDTADPKYWSLYDPPPGTPGFGEEFADNVYARTKEAIDKYQPDVLYFDGGIPDGPNRGLKLISHFYNSSIKHHGGTNAAVLTVKSNDGGVLDLERSHAPKLVTRQWQCDTAEAGWFWLNDDVINQSGDKHIKHKSSTTMLHALADIVSKNGNLLMNIALKSDGTLDRYGETLLDDFAAWMKINSEAIFGTRPFVIYGEGPTQLPGSGANELKQPMTAKDFRFTTKGDALYVIMCGWPTGGQAVIASLADGSPLVTGTIRSLRLLGHPGKLSWKRTKEGLVIPLPDQKPCEHAYVFKIGGLKGDSEAVPIPSPTSIVRPGKDGVLTLMPEHAEIHDPGNRLYVAYAENETVIALWDDSRAYVTYNKVQFAKAGRYEVSVKMAVVKPTAVLLEVAGQQLTKKAVITGGWEIFANVPLGTIEIKEPAVLPITVRPSLTQGWNRINLATITLKPAK